MRDKTCFVVQGFGKKTDFENGRTFDLDKSYDMIKEAVEKAGLKCDRADEIIHSGPIDRPMYDRLQDADLVIADLSTANLNAAFELGVRYALRPRATIVVAERDFKTPFDVGHVRILRYVHDGSDVPRMEAKNFQKTLEETIRQIMQCDDIDSPVYLALQNLQLGGRSSDGLKPSSVSNDKEPPKSTHSAGDGLRIDYSESNISLPNIPVADDDLQHVVRRVPEGQNSEQPFVSTPMPYLNKRDPFIRERQALAEAAIESQDFAAALILWRDIFDVNPNNIHVIRQLALVTAMAKLPTPESAVSNAKKLIQENGLLNATTDCETIALWGFLSKCAWDLRTDKRDITELSAAIRAYQRAFSIREDHRDGIMLSVLLEERSLVLSDTSEATADKVLARRIRSDVVQTALSQQSDNEEASDEIRFEVFQLLWRAAIDLAKPTPVDKSGASRISDPSHSFEMWLKEFYNELSNLIRPNIHFS